MDSSARKQLIPRLRAMAEPVVERLGMDLVAVELINEQGQEIIRIFIDKPGGVSVGDCSRVSHALSPTMDVDDPLPEIAYRLEVSSPGIDRPVQRRADFMRFAGFRARIRLDSTAGRRRFSGLLLGLDGDDLLLQVEGSPEPQRHPLERVDRVRLLLDADEYARLGKEGPPLLPGESPPPDHRPGTAPHGEPHDQ